MVKPVLYRDNARPQGFLEALQNAILNRISRPYSKNQQVTYEFTTDRGLLHQYYRLREIMYRKMFDTDRFVGEEDTHDKLSHILIARRGRLCLGGCRLTIREPDEMWQLPLESVDFKLRSLFPNLNLDKERHGEISRFAIMEDSGDDDIFLELCKMMYEKVISSRIHYLFAKSTYPLARNWRLIANGMGVKTTRICNEIDVPENPIHPGVKWYLTVSDLSTVYQPVAVEAEAEAHAPLAAEKEQPALVLVD